MSFAAAVEAVPGHPHLQVQVQAEVQVQLEGHPAWTPEVCSSCSRSPPPFSLGSPSFAAVEEREEIERSVVVSSAVAVHPSAPVRSSEGVVAEKQAQAQALVRV